MIKSLRRVSGVFIVLVIALFSSGVAHAAASPVIYQLQVGATGITNKEYISVYNNSATAVDITGWCIKYGVTTTPTTTDTANLGCITAPDAQTKLWLPAHGYMVAASSAFRADYPAATVFDIIFSSASIANKDRYIRLLDTSNTEIDRLGWGSGSTPEGTAAANPVSPTILQRLSLDSVTLKDTNNNSVDFGSVTAPTLAISTVYEVITPVDICTNLDGLQTQLPAGYLKDPAGDCQPDLCLNIDGLQTSVPPGYESADGENCALIPLESAPLLITELLPNATSYDTGNEFIEIYNPNNRPINLKGYVLQLGPSYTKSYSLPDQIIAPGTYQAFSDTQTGLILPNTTATLRLVAPNSDVVSLTAAYDQPAENNTWAMIDGLWQYTNQPTPGLANLPMLISSTSEDTATTSLAPCRQDQERNPDTNRCRLIQTAAGSLTACKPGQERNPDTNRCRSVLASTDSLVPCKPDQERNPDTNRCRSAAAGDTALTPCVQGQERNPDTNRCRKVAGASTDGLAQVKDVAANSNIASNPRWMLAGLSVAGAVGYAGFEWRREFLGLTSKLRHIFKSS